MVNKKVFEHNLKMLGINLEENDESLTINFSNGNGIIFADKSGVSIRSDECGNFFICSIDSFKNLLFDTYYDRFPDFEYLSHADKKDQLSEEQKNKTSTLCLDIVAPNRTVHAIFQIDFVPIKKLKQYDFYLDDFNLPSFTLSYLIQRLIGFVNQERFVSNKIMR